MPGEIPIHEAQYDKGALPFVEHSSGSATISYPNHAHVLPLVPSTVLAQYAVEFRPEPRASELRAVERIGQATVPPRAGAREREPPAPGPGALVAIVPPPVDTTPALPPVQGQGQPMELGAPSRPALAAAESLGIRS